MQTERARPVPFSDSLKSLPLLLTSLVVVVGLVDLVLAIQPGLLVSLRGSWQEAVPPGSGMSTFVSAAVIAGSIGLGAAALSWFGRSVRSAPYLTLAPLWVGLCMLVIGRMTTPLPIPLPTPAFVAICALLFVGSGVLFESRSTQSNAVGAGLSALPILLLILGYVLSDVTFDTNAMLLLLVLALAAGGAPVIAIACRSNGTRLSGGLGRAQAETGEQMVELLERARVAEERAARAEQQLASSPAWAGGVTASPALRVGDDDELALSRRSSGSNWVPWAVAAGAVAVLGAGYALAYAPLATELADQRIRSAKEAEALNFEMTALRASAARDKQVLEEKLTAAYVARPPGGSPEPGGSGSSAAAVALGSGSGGGVGEREASSSRRAAPADEDEDEDSAASSASAEERRAARLARREAFAAEKAAKREARLAAREEKRQARLAARAERLAARKAAGGDDGDGDEDSEEEEEEREAKAAEREAKKAEREAAREAKAAERAAKREARLAAKAERESAEEEEEEEESPKPSAKPARTEPEESSDDPLEGLDGL